MREIKYLESDFKNAEKHDKSEADCQIIGKIGDFFKNAFLKVLLIIPTFSLKVTIYGILEKEF